MRFNANILHISSDLLHITWPKNAEYDQTIPVSEKIFQIYRTRCNSVFLVTQS
jgi:hypothetical protein